MFSYHSVNSAIVLYNLIHSAVVCPQWRPSRSVVKVRWRRKKLKLINSTINSHNGKRKGTKQMPARQGNKNEAISRAAAIRMVL